MFMGLQAMFSSISGLQSDSQWLDVIGNNISNVNTVAYKASRAEFANQFSQTLLSGSGDNPSTGQGGVDPRQVGLGTRLASIETIFTQGTTINTGITTDISIQGNGFLVAKQGNQSYLTRAGNLTFDSQGYLVNANGDRIQGINATLQYAPTIINSARNGGFAQVTNAELNLNSAEISSTQSIQIDPQMTLAPKATTEVSFKGNLDALQQPNVLDLVPNYFLGPPPTWKPTLPIGLALALNIPPLNNGIDTNRMTLQPTATGGFTLQQVQNLDTFIPGINPPPAPLENGYINLGTAQAYAGSYLWDQQPPIPPADQMNETVYDSNGNARQITVQFYQVNDLGADGINNPSGPNQVCYAWYAFDTTGGQSVSTADLVGGTGIGEGDFSVPGQIFTYDRGLFGQGFFGDFLWFNTDGSLASSGGVGGVQGVAGLNFNYMSIPRIYLPPENSNPPVSAIPTQGAEITVISLNFGDFGLLGTGERNGLYSDADGSYKMVNGVNNYVPNNTVYAASQDGYAEGQLQGLSFDPTGVIEGAFSNGQTLGLAQVALEQVQNPEGLSQAGNNDFTLSSNTGTSHIGIAGQGNFGAVQDDSLEGSNVDLTTELSNMIVAQRGFDTNSRMMAIVNQMMDTIDHLGQ